MLSAHVCMCICACGTVLGRTAGSHSVTQKGRGGLAMWTPAGEISVFEGRLQNICSSGIVFVNILEYPGISQDVPLKDLL